MLIPRIAVKTVFFVNGFIYATWVSRLPRIQDLYGADNGEIGLALLAMSIGAVGAMPFTGWVVVKSGSHRITLWSAFLYAIMIVAIPYMQHFAGLIALFLGIGVITGTLDVAMNAQAVMIEQQYHKPIMTSFHALFSIGMAVGAWIGALFAQLDQPLIVHFSVVTGGALLLVLVANRHLLKDDKKIDEHDDTPLLRLPTRAMVGVGLIAFCCMTGEGAVGDWSVNYMENFTEASKSLAPLALSAFALAMTIGRLTGDRARAEFGDGVIIMSGGVMASLGLLITLLLPYPFIAIAGFFLVGIGLSTIVPIAYSLAGNAKGLAPGVGLAMVTTVGYTGFLLGPPVIGFIAKWQSLRVALIFVLALLLVMTVLGSLREKD